MQAAMATIALILIVSDIDPVYWSVWQWLTLLFWTKFFGVVMLWLDIEWIVWYKKLKKT